jgi:hypothetical protein
MLTQKLHQRFAWAVAPLLLSMGCSATKAPSEIGETTATGPDAVTGAGAAGAASSGVESVGSGGSKTPALPIEVSPVHPMLDVDFQMPAPPTVQFHATYVDSGKPVSAQWSLSSYAAGTIDAEGLFTASALAGGKITVVATAGEAKAETTVTIKLHLHEGNADPAEQAILEGPGSLTDPNFALWAPYDKTVFPRGIPSPQLQPSPSGQAPTKYYLELHGAYFDYAGFLDVAPQLKISQAAWDALAASSDGNDIDVSLSKLVADEKVGPLKQTWQVAKGKLLGTIYYNTYDSILAGYTGAIMRIKGGSLMPEVLVGNCTGCHSISSDGSTAAAANHSGMGGIFDLTGGTINPPVVWQDPERAAFAAMYPKGGAVFVVSGQPAYYWPPNTPGTQSSWLSELRTKTGGLVPSSGIEGYYAQTPVFSHDGTMLAFVDRSPVLPYSSKLALLHYDAATQKFSNYEVLATPPPGQHYSWAAFTPDNKHIVYQAGVGDDLATWNANTGKLFAVNLQSKAITELKSLNGDGYMAQGMRDENLNFEPTILPVASGGYFWVMFTSRRTYGNLLTGNRDQTKRLWVSAFDIGAQDGVDATHPAFYIAGQELSSGNSRGFWALDPCKADGQTCESGVECCAGACAPDPGAPPKPICGPVKGCAQEGDACTGEADCCDPALACINGHCSLSAPK